MPNDSRELIATACIAIAVVVGYGSADMAIAMPSSSPGHAFATRSDSSTSFQESLRAVNEGRFVDAIQLLQGVIRDSPESPEPYNLIRTAYGLLGRDHAQLMIDSELFAKVVAASEGHRFHLAEQIATEWLAMHFANPIPHALLAAIRERDGKIDIADQDRKISRGLLRAILATGDGTTASTAFLVQSLSEEQLIVEQVLRCRRIRAQPETRPHRQLTISCGGDERFVFFDLSVIDDGRNTAHRNSVYRRSCHVCGHEQHQ